MDRTPGTPGTHRNTLMTTPSTSITAPTLSPWKRDSHGAEELTEDTATEKTELQSRHPSPRAFHQPRCPSGANHPSASGKSCVSLCLGFLSDKIGGGRHNKHLCLCISQLEESTILYCVKTAATREKRNPVSEFCLRTEMLAWHGVGLAAGHRAAACPRVTGGKPHSTISAV